MKSFKKDLISGVIYTGIAKYSGLIINLIVTAILARILKPSDFGIIAISSVFINFFAIISDMGVGPAIIQNKSLTKVDYSYIFTFTIYLGIALSIILFIISYFIGVIYNEDSLILIIQLLTINLFFATINVVPNAILLKGQEFRFISIRTMSIQLTTGILAIIVAFNGGGIYALLINPIISAILIFAINYYRNPIGIKFKYKNTAISKIAQYSSYQFLFNLINYFSRNTDKLLVGKYLGMKSLGFYEKSYTLMLLPLSNITNVLTPVMHPMFSNYQDDFDKIVNHYLKIVKILAFIGFPLSVLLYFTSKELVLIIFGDQWTSSIAIFKILTYSVVVQILASSSGSIFQATNSTKYLFISGLISAVTIITGLIFCIYYFKSIESIAYSIVISYNINFFQSFYILFKVVLKKHLLPFFKTLLLPFISSVILFVILIQVQYFVIIESLFLSLLLKTSIVVGFQLLFMRLSHAFKYEEK